MNGVHFDRIAKRFASTRSRRSVLGGLAATGFASALGMNAEAQNATPVPTPSGQQPEWLLVIQFNAAEVIPESDSIIIMNLSGAAPEAVAFTDRPTRQFKVLPITEVVDLISSAASGDPLNADLVAQFLLHNESEQVVIEILSVTYNADEETIQLRSRVLGAEVEGTPLPIEAGQLLQSGNLFIDNVVLSDGTCLYVTCANGDCCEFECCNGKCCAGTCMADGTCCKLDACGDNCCPICNAKGECCEPQDPDCG